MKKIKYIAVFISCILFINCNDKKLVNSTENNKLLEKYFNKSERNDLTKIIAFANNQILSKNKLSSSEKAYKLYLNSIIDELSQNNSIAFNEKVKYDFLFNLSPTLFEKIWIKENPPKLIKTKDTILYSPKDYVGIEFNAFGDYMKYLKELSVQDEKYKSIYESINLSGDLSNSTISGILINREKFNFENFNDKLWVSIMLLSIEIPVEQKVEQYLN